MGQKVENDPHDPVWYQGHIQYHGAMEKTLDTDDGECSDDGEGSDDRD